MDSAACWSWWIVSSLLFMLVKVAEEGYTVNNDASSCCSGTIHQGRALGTGHSCADAPNAPLPGHESADGGRAIFAPESSYRFTNNPRRDGAGAIALWPPLRMGAARLARYGPV